MSFRPTVFSQEELRRSGIRTALSAADDLCYFAMREGLEEQWYEVKGGDILLGHMVYWRSALGIPLE